MDRLSVGRATSVGYLAALAGLPMATVPRLRVLLAHHDPEQAYAVVARRHPPHPAVEAMLSGAVGRAWSAAIADRPPEEWDARCARWSIGAVTAADDWFPDVLRHDPQPPAVLFFRGDWAAVGHRTVGVVGTRNATAPGQQFAMRLGRELAGAGVCVVSGLARGIDAAAHHGALHGMKLSRDGGGSAGAVVGVVANGLDAPYPRQNAALWEAVCERGLLLSEWPPGTEPERFRFPLRNRIIAALSEILVVVESREKGGSLTTVREALERSVEVMAVPGSVHCRAASGTNQLLRDGAAPVTEPSDVLLALGLEHRRDGGRLYDPRPLPRGVEAAVLERCRSDACTLDHLVSELELSVADAAMAVARLERTGWVREAGGWFEPVDIGGEGP